MWISINWATIISGNIRRQSIIGSNANSSLDPREQALNSGKFGLKYNNFHTINGRPFCLGLNVLTYRYMLSCNVRVVWVSGNLELCICWAHLDVTIMMAYQEMVDVTQVQHSLPQQQCWQTRGSFRHENHIFRFTRWYNMTMRCCNTLLLVAMYYFMMVTINV